ncbi:Kinesin-like protein [Spironucleus salmonicida]|uniref:Kinesin-like protein n=1 Tax=Spironucleus salmonicida TaxID=348837 RepID=V6LXR5_9EUKA|nr:Kinesin-like protein [Spironucleus salmonicida]|eukprot:EST49427.1 Kinesin [Spironucleus salmonicida]
MSDDNVKVLIRCRPFNQREANEGATQIIRMNKPMGQVQVEKPFSKDISGKQLAEKSYQTFTFDAVYGQNDKDQWSTQIEVFDESVRPAVEFVLQGFNSTVFAYGQTGSGKTYTMMGYGDDIGMIPMAIQRIFDYISSADDDTSYLVRCSFYEIYNEQIRDLMTGILNLPVNENPDKGVYINGLTEYQVQSDKEINDIMEKGNKHRSVAATKMNATSSRSHSIFQVIVECQQIIEGKETVRVGKLNLVDLAGSERQGKTEATGDRLKEGAKINLSLSNLGIVIQKLVDQETHIPYRQSKLTHLLKDSLGGNSKTLMVVAVSPASTNFEETMSTLRYADRAKRIKNKAKVNEDPKDAQIREMKDQIQSLEEQLQKLFSGVQPDTEEGQQHQAEQIQIIQEKLSKIHVVKKLNVKKLSEDEIELQKNQHQQLLNRLQQKEAKSEAARKFVQQMAEKIEQQKRQLSQKEQLQTEQEQQERELRIARQEIADRKVAAQQLKRQLEEQAEKEVLDEQNYQNIQEEIDALKRKSEKYSVKNQEKLDEYQNQQSENAREREIRQVDMERIQMQIAQKQAILDYFIPKNIQKQLEEMCELVDGEWKIRGGELSGNYVRGIE